MRRLFFGRRAQSITEYAIMVSIVIGALIAMQTYVKNSLSAKIKIAADGIHEGHEYLYQPKTTTATSIVLNRPGTETRSINETEIKELTTGAGTSTVTDESETKFHELQVEQTP